MFRGLALVFCMTLLAVSTRVMFAETQAARLIRQADASAIPLGPLAAPSGRGRILHSGAWRGHVLIR